MLSGEVSSARPLALLTYASRAEEPAADIRTSGSRAQRAIDDLFATGPEFGVHPGCVGSSAAGFALAGLELDRWVAKVGGAFLAADDGGLFSIFGTVTVSTAELEAMMTVDWVKVDAASERVRSALDAGGLGVRGDDLEAIEDAIAGLNPAEADAVVSRLSDIELKRWMDNLHEGWFKGGWDHERRQEMWSRLVPLLGLETLDRIGRFTDDLEPSYAGVRNTERAEWRRLTGPLFALGDDPATVHVDDIRQGMLGDCYLLSALAAIGAIDPAVLTDRVRANPNGTFTVTLYEDDGDAVPITVTPDFPVLGSDPAFARESTTPDVDGVPIELWPLVFEKAYAQWKGGYDDIEGGHPHEAMEEVLGRDSFHADPDDLTFDELVERHDGRHAIALSTFSDGDGKERYESEDLYTSHAYFVTDVDRESGTISVQNPWGADHGVLTFTFDELRENFRDVSFIEV